MYVGGWQLSLKNRFFLTIFNGFGLIRFSLKTYPEDRTEFARSRSAGYKTRRMVLHLPTRYTWVEKNLAEKLVKNDQILENFPNFISFFLQISRKLFVGSG